MILIFPKKKQHERSIETTSMASTNLSPTPVACEAILLEDAA